MHLLFLLNALVYFSDMNNTRKALIFILGFTILILNLSCKTQYSTIELNNNFTTEQKADLKKITDFFKREMCLNMDSDFKTCFKRIPHEYLEATGNSFWTNINYEKQKKLYEQISKSTFDEIWDLCKSTYPESGIELSEICSKYNGKYQKYLIELGRHNETIKKYADRVTGAGDFSLFQLSYWEIMKNKKDLNLNDPNIQLIIAIHYLSLNDEEKRNSKPDLPNTKF